MPKPYRWWVKIPRLLNHRREIWLQGSCAVLQGTWRIFLLKTGWKKTKYYWFYGNIKLENIFFQILESMLRRNVLGVTKTRKRKTERNGIRNQNGMKRYFEYFFFTQFSVLKRLTDSWLTFTEIEEKCFITKCHKNIIEQTITYFGYI